jgi:hypothetical protein
MGDGHPSGEDPSKLKADEVFAYGVDSGQAASLTRVRKRS